MRLRFEEWMARKGLTCQNIVDSGVVTEVALLAMADRLGVIPPVDLQEFQNIWAAQSATNVKVAEAKPKDTKVSEASTPSKSKTGARTARRRSTRKKSNIKDDEK